MTDQEYYKEVCRLALEIGSLAGLDYDTAMEDKREGLTAEESARLFIEDYN